MDPSFRRELSANHRLDITNFTDFADGYPVLVASTASLQRISAETKVRVFSTCCICYRGDVKIISDHFDTHFFKCF
jgi:hypothetical protein